MEEGPEPQELMEQVEDNIHARHGEAAEARTSSAEHKARHMRSAITAAILAVLAALGSLLSGHAANDAILLQSKASDQWAYYQAKSTKGHLYEVNKTLVEAFMQMQQPKTAAAQLATGASKPLELLSKEIDSKMKGYDQEKKVVEDKATELSDESTHAFASHELYSFGVACFQIGIVLASVSILVESAPLYFMSVGGGIVGTILLLAGYFR
ncbi:MAG: DUF4337 family protein [Cyanobacteria bacterium REEB67]|nr:DUF4337 family protein [Cyanobacteria bacterium REEB67]